MNVDGVGVPSTHWQVQSVPDYVQQTRWEVMVVVGGDGDGGDGCDGGSSDGGRWSWI